MKHKHAELIKAWADGAEIQIRNTGFGGYAWVDDYPTWNPDFEYRIKPKTVRYRLYLYRGSTTHRLRVGLQEGYESDKTFSDGFIKYLCDWQEVEV